MLIVKQSDYLYVDLESRMTISLRRSVGWANLSSVRSLRHFSIFKIEYQHEADPLESLGSQEMDEHQNI